MHEWLDQLQILIIGTSSEALHNASFLIWPTFQGHRGQSSKFHCSIVGTYFVWPRMFYPCVNLGTMYIHIKFRPERISNMAQVAILETQTIVLLLLT
jgi:hypothetical protein